MSQLSHEDLRTLFRQTPTAVVMVDADGRIRNVNPRAADLFGYRPDELIGEKVEVLVPEGLRERHREHRSGYMENPSRRPMGIGMELAGRRKDGSRVPVEISLSPVDLEDGFRVMATVQDISERRELRSWGIEAVEAAEEERLRIAHELHDDLAQRLATLQMMTRLIDRAEEVERQELLEELRRAIRGSSEHLRELIRGLRPPALSDLGLGAALRNEVDRQLDGRDVGRELALDPLEPRPGEHVELTLFRVGQEALRNAVQHAEPSTVIVRLGRREDDEIELEVKDDGRGFDPDEVGGRGERFGLIGMRERCGAVGGRLEVSSRPGSGTRVRALVPQRRRGRSYEAPDVHAARRSRGTGDRVGRSR